MITRVGKQEWLRTFAGWLVIGSFFAYWAVARSSATIDVLSFFLGQILFASVFAGAALSVLRRFGFSWPIIFQKTIAWTPLAALPGLVDLIWKWFFPTWQQTYAAGSSFIISFLTLGLFPHPLTSLGLSLALILALVLMGRWMRTVLPFKKVFNGLVACFVIWSVLLLTPSLIGWMHGAIGPSATPFFGTSIEIERGLSAMVANGYWGKDAHQRFSTPIGNEGSAAVERLFAALAFFALAVGVFIFSPLKKLSWRNRFAFLRPELAMTFGALAVLGWSVGFVQKAGMAWRFDGVVSFATFVVTILAAWTYIAGRNDVFDLAEDERNHSERPLASGMISMQELQEALPMFLTLSLIGGWILGWPVLASLAVFLAASELYSAPPFRGKETFPFNVGLLALGETAFMLANWFFARTEGDWSNVPLRLFFGVLASLGLFATVRIQRFSKPIWLNRAILFAGFLTPAIFLFSLNWLLFGAALGIAAVYYMSHKPPQTRIVWRLIWLYYALSGLLFASHWIVLLNS